MPRARFETVACLAILLSFSGGLNETHASSGPAVRERTATRAEPGPTNRRGPFHLGKCQLEWRVPHLRSRSPENQPGAESAMGEAEGSHAKAHDLSGWPQENRSGAESQMGKGQQVTVTTIRPSTACRSPKLDRGLSEPHSLAVFSVEVVDQRFIAQINHHRMVLIIETSVGIRRSSGLAARLIHPYTNPPAAP